MPEADLSNTGEGLFACLFATGSLRRTANPSDSAANTKSFAVSFFKTFLFPKWHREFGVESRERTLRHAPPLARFEQRRSGEPKGTLFEPTAPGSRQSACDASRVQGRVGQVPLARRGLAGATSADMVDSARPILVFVVGPGAVGKMTVGTELAARTGLKLFHNHHTIDLVLRFFPWGSPPFVRLLSEFRRRIFEEVAGSELPGLIFTYVWAFDQPGDDAEVELYAWIFRSRGAAVYYVELQAPQNVRLERNESDFRLAEKPFKRDVAESRRQLVSLDATYRLDSGDRFAGRADYLRIDNTNLSPAEVAEVVIARFGLPTKSA